METCIVVCLQLILLREISTSNVIISLNISNYCMISVVYPDQIPIRESAVHLSDLTVGRISFGIRGGAGREFLGLRAVRAKGGSGFGLARGLSGQDKNIMIKRILGIVVNRSRRLQLADFRCHTNLCL